MGSHGSDVWLNMFGQHSFKICSDMFSTCFGYVLDKFWKLFHQFVSFHCGHHRYEKTGIFLPTISLAFLNLLGIPARHRWAILVLCVGLRTKSGDRVLGSAFALPPLPLPPSIAVAEPVVPGAPEAESETMNFCQSVAALDRCFSLRRATFSCSALVLASRSRSCLYFWCSVTGQGPELDLFAEVVEANPLSLRTRCM